MLPLLIISLYKHGFFFIPSLHVEFYLYQKIFITVIQICHNLLNSFQKTWQPEDIYDWPLKLFSNNKFSFGTWVYHLLLLVLHSRTDLTPIAPNWAMCLLSTDHVQTTKHCRFYRGQQLGPVPHNTGHAAISTFIAYIKVYVETFSLHTSTSGIKSHYLFVLCRVKRNKHRSNTYRAVITQ